MKQYTTSDQTAKLIELGFEKPKGLADAEPSSGVWVRPAYSIGELIEMLPEEITIDDFTHERVIAKNEVLYYSWVHEVYFYTFDKNDELIDNLFEACVKLKEEGVI